MPACSRLARQQLRLGVSCAVLLNLALLGSSMLIMPVAQAEDSLAVAQAAGVDYPTRRRTFTPGELARLPEYCQFQHGMPGRDTARGRYYVSALGKALDDIHHYCRGLRDITFAQTYVLPPIHKQALLDRAVQEVMYMIKTNPDTMILMPEIHYRYGDLMLQLGRAPEAQAAFEKSRLLKPDYWPAYTRWADFLINSKQIEQARAVVEEGLKHAPDSPELQQRFSRVSSTIRP